MFKFVLPVALCLAMLAGSAVAVRPAEAPPVEVASTSARLLESDTTKGPYASQDLAKQWLAYYVSLGWSHSYCDYNFTDGHWYVYLVK